MLMRRKRSMWRRRGKVNILSLRTYKLKSNLRN